MRTESNETELLRDALDHISRIAGSARTPTKRLDWIDTRARMALKGIEWSRDYLPEPKKQIDERTRDLQRALIKIVAAYEGKDSDTLREAIDAAKNAFPSLLYPTSPPI